MNQILVVSRFRQMVKWLKRKEMQKPYRRNLRVGRQVRLRNKGKLCSGDLQYIFGRAFRRSRGERGCGSESHCKLRL